MAAAPSTRARAQQARRERERMEKELQEKVESTHVAPITRADVWQAAMWVATNTNRVPTLWGPTAVGKTYGVHELAKQHDGEVVTVLLAQHTPDEIMGFQMPGKDNQLVEQLPYWARRVKNILADGRKAFVLFDELNLAREEVRGAAYTFLRDRTIHGEDFNNPNVIVFAAMNPGMLGAAYLSRCCLFHIPAETSYLLEVAGDSELGRTAALHGQIAVEGEDRAYSNEPPPAPMHVEASAIAAIRAAERSVDFWNMTPAARGLIISSLVPPAIATEIAGGLKMSLSGDELVKDPDLIFETIRALEDNIPEAMNIITSILSTYPYTDKMVAARAHAKLHEAVYTDDPELKLAENYFFNFEEGRKHLLSLDTTSLIQAFEETGWIIPDKNGGRPTGRLYERLDQAVAYNLANPLP